MNSTYCINLLVSLQIVETCFSKFNFWSILIFSKSKFHLVDEIILFIIKDLFPLSSQLIIIAWN